MGFTITIPIKTRRKLLQRIFSSNCPFEHPRLSMELKDRAVEVPMMKTNLQRQGGEEPVNLPH